VHTVHANIEIVYLFQFKIAQTDNHQLLSPKIAKKDYFQIHILGIVG
jgi:hypothetical protein